MGNLQPAKACANSQLVSKPVFLRSSSNPINTRTALNAIFQAENLVFLSINQFSGPAYPRGVAGAAAQVGSSMHLDPLQQRIDALLGCQGETN